MSDGDQPLPAGEARDEELEEAVSETEAAESHAAASSDGFKHLLQKLSTEHKFDFREYKETSLARRIQRRMKQVRIESFDDYLKFMDRHPNEHVALIDSILINVTSFFRDPEAWD